jgi:phospholipid/cholesterol/gamma-HCH transport system substrate-binding protein
MQKQAPSLGRILAMVIFALSCFGLLYFLWSSFGGIIPLKPQGYRFDAAFTNSNTLVNEADVRIAGVNVGKVKAKRLAPGGRETLATIQLDDKYGPIPADTRAILRQKTLLGETYVQLSPGSPQGPKLKEGSTLPGSSVAPTVALDQLLSLFDPKTRQAFRDWQQESAKTVQGPAGQDVNDALGNLPSFSENGASILAVLDQQSGAVTNLIHNTGEVFAALNQRQGELAQLVQNSNNFFGATASRDRELAQTIATFPTFLDESRTTLARLQNFSARTDPLVNDLKPVADNLGPTVHDLGQLAPDLRLLFANMRPLINESGNTLPQGVRFLQGAPPLFKGLRTFLPQLNPDISYLNFNRQNLADFISVGDSAIGAKLPPLEPGQESRHYLRQFGIINDRSLTLNQQQPPYTRGNAYFAPNAYERARAFGVLESFSCSPAGGQQTNPSPTGPPCFVQPPSLFDNLQFPRLEPGQAPVIEPPQNNQGTRPAQP